MRLQPYCRSATYSIKKAYQAPSHTSQTIFEPLRILFCGSDEFSITSLRALHGEFERDKALIESIDVVCRPPKPVGRGLRDVRPGRGFQLQPSLFILNQGTVPISRVAKELALTLHEIDTFTKWKVSLS